MATRNTSVNDDDTWTDVPDDKQIILENIGDTFTGVYLGMEPVNYSSGNAGKIAHFEIDGTPCFINAGRDLQRKLEKVPLKALTRVTWTDNLDTGQDTPMRVFKVQHRA